MKPGGDGVAGNVAGANFSGDSHGEADQSGFRCGVVGLSGLAHLAEDAGDVDDASPALFEHGADHRLNAEIGRSEIGLQNGVPVGAFHAHDELVAGDAGIVDQDVDFAELGDDGFDGGFNLLFVGNVESECGCCAAGGGDFGDQFI